MLCLYGRQCLSQGVSCHVICRTIDKLDCTCFDNITNKMVPNINMFRLSMIVAIMSESNSGFTVAEQGGGGGGGASMDLKSSVSKQ